MFTSNLGYPRIGSGRELKKACENYWSGKITEQELLTTAKQLKLQNWQLQKEAGIDLIPSNDFSFYDQVLDLSLTLGAIPQRYKNLKGESDTDLYFAMARGYQKDGHDITAMEMTKWFDTNYHYIVPEFYKEQEFSLFSKKIIEEFVEAKDSGILTKPVLIGPVSYLLLGKEKEEGFEKIGLIKKLLPVYLEIIAELVENGVEWIQFDEPFLALDLKKEEKDAFIYVYNEIKNSFPSLKLLLLRILKGLQIMLGWQPLYLSAYCM